ncbi:MAG: phosphate ABC transporter substrate-binding protein [Thalassotalea sp.]|nr:phosphate ABC transporter substrate-binding protein [Thalassotalea sp.]
MRYVNSIILLALSLIALNVQAVTVIVHPSNANALDKKSFQKIFLGKSKKFPDGSQVVPIDLTGGDARSKFLDSVIGKSESQLKAYWSKLIFTGKGQAPRSVDTEAEVVKLVSQNPNLIGYISDGAVDDTVKVAAKF